MIFYLKWKTRSGVFILVISVCLFCFSAGSALTGYSASAQETSESNSAARQQFTQLVAEGSRALENGENATAESSFRRALTLDPQSVELLNNLAISVARQGRNDDAIALYLQALALKKDDPITRRNLGVAYFRAHRYKEALPLLQAFAAATPTFQSLNLTGLTLFALDQYSSAAVYLERASRLQPDDLPTLDILGKAYWRGKNRSGVTRVFDRIMAIDPNSVEAHFMMGLAYDLMYEEPQAAKEFQAVLATDPNYPSVHSSLGLIDYREHNVAGAEHEFQQELSRYPDDPISNYMMGQLLRQQQAQARAVPYLKAAVAVNPSYRDALFELGQCYLELNEPQAALDPLKKVTEVDPDFAQAHFVLGRALMMLGRSDDAKRERDLSRQIQVRQHAQTNSPPKSEPPKN
jgi:tetratricopeptide (TPR) repeat protein